MNIYITYAALLTAFFSIALLALVAWKARRAHRSLWCVLENERKKNDEVLRDSYRQWQLCYGRLIAHERGLPTPLRLTAQSAEDVFLLDYFRENTCGVYVEAGAYDGVCLSNTYALSQLGWRGLLVEASPVNAERCRQNRPNDFVEHCAIGGPDANGTITFTVAEGNEAFSFVHADESHMNICLAKGGTGFKKITVPSMSLSQILKMNNITSVDLLSLDIEGGEAQALQGWNFDQIRPRLIVVEANSIDAENKLMELLGSLHYRLIHRRAANLFFESGL